jgi:hypothetical protein
MSPRETRYENACAKARPFEKDVERTLQQEMVLETAGLMRKAVE